MILLDELKPTDIQSNVYMSTTSLKSFNDVSGVITQRSRNNDLVIPAGIPRITTGNAESHEEFFGCFDSQALQRKTITFFIKKRLVTEKWVQSLNFMDNVAPEQVIVSNFLRGRMAAVEAETSSADSTADVGCCGLTRPRRS